MIAPDSPTLAPVPVVTPPILGIDLADRTLTAALNVAVFTPYAVYLALGKRPPGWLIAASLGWLMLQFADDMQYLVKGRQAGLQGLGCGCTPGHPPPPNQPMSFPQTRNFRVNR